MKGRLFLSLLLLCGACSKQAASTNQDKPTPPKASVAAASAPKAFAVDERNALVEFHFGWSAEAAAVPQLVERFRSQMLKSKAELIAAAEEDKAFREREGFDFNAFMSTTDYETAGQSARLLSLSVESGSFTGGAHGNYGVGSLLWDRVDKKEIQPSDLFAEPANMDRLLTQRWCDALNKAREEKRGEQPGGGGIFDDCPPLDKIAIIPGDEDGNGRFDRLMMVASPYVAGPWVEGAYEIELVATPDLVAALKGIYRTSFEIAQTQ